MPELPEVETVRRRLAPHVEGRTLAEVEIRDERLTAPEPPMAVAAELNGDSVLALRRRGKYLLWDLGDGGALAVHLRMTGNLLVLPDGAVEPPFTRALATLDDGTRIAYTDVRRFGTWRLLAEDELRPWLAARVGPEPLDGWQASDFARAIAPRRAPVKAVLLDQRVVAGVGNIYADEALWRARVHPRTPAHAVSRRKAGELHAAVIEVLQAGIDAQGASIRDFRTPDGGYGSAQERFLVYGHGGEPCERCGTTLARDVVGQRGTVFCPRCQRIPRNA